MRYAVYFTPPHDHPLTQAAAAWLGRDAFSSVTTQVDGREKLVSEAARYGFHGTLKAPFHLKDGMEENDLLAAFDLFSSETPGFLIDELTLGQLGPFFALVPGKNSHGEIAALATDCVKTFEPFRAPLSPQDIARRNPDALPRAQRQNLIEWGYPYVFEAFRFHMTLTSAVCEVDRIDVQSRLEMHFSPFLGKPLDVSHLALFVEQERGEPFKVLRIEALAAPLNLLQAKLS